MCAAGELNAAPIAAELRIDRDGHKEDRRNPKLVEGIDEASLEENFSQASFSMRTVKRVTRCIALRAQSGPRSQQSAVGFV